MSMRSLIMMSMRSSSSIQFLAHTMSFRPKYRGVLGRRQFSNHRDSNFPSIPNQRFRPISHPLPPPFNQRASSRPPPFYRNQGHFRQQQQQKPLDYRNWEFAKTLPPPHCERFTVLSYNILADYLAYDHRSKLYFHIPPHILDWEWRKKRIVFELGLWSADILCFQEVDKFEDLEEELKVHGYCGIWKMRTGNPLDGCAVFWRSSRFKLLHDESIEFNKLGLRDNVAQICVFESMNQNDNRYETSGQASTVISKKVVICNTHVLYNPRRGEIKLGQVRVLLDRAYAVSKLWDNSPVILCGDFNCTPKSPLYNFISEQKIDLSKLPRDKLSGQSSAEIGPRSFSHYSRNRSPGVPTVVNDREFGHSNIPTDNSVHAPVMAAGMNDGLRKTVLDTQKKKEFVALDSNRGNSPFTNSFPKLDEKDGHNSKIDLKHCATSSSLVEGQGGYSIDQKKDSMHDDLAVHCFHDDVYPIGHKEGHHRTSSDSHGSSTEHCPSNLCDANEIFNCEKGSDNVHTVIEIIPEPASTLNPAEVVIPNTSADILLDEKMEDKSHNKIFETIEDVNLGEDCNSFLSSLHNNDISIPSGFNQLPQSSSFENIESSEYDLVSDRRQLHPSCVGVQNDYSGCFNPSNVERTTYDPSKWTPAEIETATGSSDCTLIEHNLKLRSSYSEVEDSSGTRDSNGEPVVTSYNRCFLGTVDYIWHSEGLQTVRVLAPIPKHAMQWTHGFPTKKWGSDHIALVSEMAFINDPCSKEDARQPKIYCI